MMDDWQQERPGTNVTLILNCFQGKTSLKETQQVNEWQNFIATNNPPTLYTRHIDMIKMTNTNISKHIK